MKRNLNRSHKKSLPPLAWREEEYAALLSKAAVAFEDRVSEEIFDFDDERAEVDVIVQRMNHDAN